jgi:hypothetical protein
MKNILKTPKILEKILIVVLFIFFLVLIRALI